MLDACQDNVTDSEGYVDTQASLWVLGSLAGYYRRPFDAELVLKRFSLPFDLPSLIEALEVIGLKAGLVSWPEADFSPLTLPAVAFVTAPAQATANTTDDRASPHRPPLVPALIIKHAGHILAWVRPGGSAPERLSLDAARTRCAPLLLLVAEAEPPLTESAGQAEAVVQQKKPFGFSWFVPELLRHKSLWRDILFASLAIQLVGLATPLFTQVIIDKVIAHHSESTLIVLGAALVVFVFVLFTSTMSWLRQYLVLHTGSRIDAVLGEKVMRHLLRLPLPYFEQRQRIAIARALLKHPKVRIFDEAISNLDQQTAEHFAQTINRLKGRVTMIFITHQVPHGLQVDEAVNMGQHALHMSLEKEPT